MKKVTMKDIAKVANVSHTTVSRALSGSPEIGAVTRARILNISHDMGYTTASAARSLAGKKSKTMGLIASSVISPFTAEIAYYIEQQALESGYNLILCNSTGDLEKEEAAYRLLVNRQVDGIIIKPSNAKTFERVSPYFDLAPTVFLNEARPGSKESYVCVDNYGGACMGTEYLYSLGHRQIVFFGKYSGRFARVPRADGYADTCKKYGITPQYVENTTGRSTEEYGYEKGRAFFLSNDDCTAIFANNDAVALGILRAADECGVRIPEDVSLLGFDNIAYAALPRIHLTTIAQPKQEIAAVAVNMLLEKIQFPSLGYSQRIMKPSLVERNSCRPVADRQ
ncbi:LacI family transcriptional regulator [Christensenellaceae bacterium OttesenSCG-928-L17]|nr:LacI family transcriptional regulator [Christensenellaceae bacterium OttesenSCG-928-L17]